MVRKIRKDGGALPEVSGGLREDFGGLVIQRKRCGLSPKWKRKKSGTVSIECGFRSSIGWSGRNLLLERDIPRMEGIAVMVSRLP